MAKIIIDLEDGFFIEQDETTCILKQGKTVYEGDEPKIKVESLGYFKSVGDCIERCIRLKFLSENDGAIFPYKKYKEWSEKAYTYFSGGIKDEV